MNQDRARSRRFHIVRGFIWALVIAVQLSGLSGPIGAQPASEVAVAGYVTALDLPSSFDVNGQKVQLKPGVTTWGMKGDKVTLTDSPVRDQLKIGAYVWVRGPVDHHIITAEAVYFRDDSNRKLTGFGPIGKVISSGPEPIFRADGYPIRISPSAQVSFHGEVHSLADVGPNTWLHYEARRGPDGILVASRAVFFSVPPKRVKTVNGVEDVKMQYDPPDFDKHKDGRVMMGVVGTWYPIPADHDVQDRVSRIAMSLVPAAQRSLPDSDPAKIHFHFYVVDNPKLRYWICSPRGGLILFPKNLLVRFPNDSQLAAVLGEAVAYILQRQGMSNLMSQHKALGEELGSLAVYGLSPLAGAALDMAGALPDKKIVDRLTEQRGRLLLAMMADAGYDPWQAPEAFRIVTVKEMPNNITFVKYPDFSGYLLGVLSLQYRQGSDTAPANPAPVARN